MGKRSQNSRESRFCLWVILMPKGYKREISGKDDGQCLWGRLRREIVGTASTSYMSGSSYFRWVRKACNAIKLLSLYTMVVYIFFELIVEFVLRTLNIASGRVYGTHVIGWRHFPQTSCISSSLSLSSHPLFRSERETWMLWRENWERARLSVRRPRTPPARVIVSSENELRTISCCSILDDDIAVPCLQTR